MPHSQLIQAYIDRQKKRNYVRKCHCGKTAHYRVGRLLGFCQDHKEDAVRAGKNQSQRWNSWAENNSEVWRINRDAWNRQQEPN